MDLSLVVCAEGYQYPDFTNEVREFIESYFFFPRFFPSFASAEILLFNRLCL